MNSFEYKASILINSLRAIVLFLSVGLLLGCTNDQDINLACSDDYGWRVWERISCINAQKKQKAEWKKEQQEEEERRRKEAASRPCVAIDIKRMEKKVRDLKDYLSVELNQIQSLDQIRQSILIILKDDLPKTGFKDPWWLGVISPSTDNIKENELIFNIPTKCEGSNFYFLVNVRSNENNQLRWLRTYAENSPQGYKSDLHPEFSVEFEAIRKRELEELRKKERLAQPPTDLVPSLPKGATQQLPDPCAPGLSKKERLARLAKFGTIRQDRDDSYSVPGHELSFYSDRSGGGLLHCH